MLNIPERICHRSKSMALMQSDMEPKKCYVCGKAPLTKDEIGLTMKLIDKKSTIFYCLPCLSEYLEVMEEELIAKIEEFKSEGCIIFK